MTMRTYRHFACQNGHQGVETTSENDQPYSKAWEQVSTQGLKRGSGSNGTVNALKPSTCPQTSALSGEYDKTTVL